MLKTETLRFVEEGHKYFHGERELISITTVLKEAGLINPAYFSEESRARGTAVHIAAHYLDQNDLDWETVDPSIEGYVRAYEKARNRINFQSCLVELKSGVVEDWAGLQLAAQEICLLSGDNDLEFPNRELLIEKPVCNLFYGFAGTLDRCFPGNRLNRYALELNPNGSYKLHPFNDPKDKDVFLSFLTGVNWRRNHK